ncbi:MAG: hypothetical protein ABI612_14485 [Betaproteobacteria bacterium]
MNTLNWILAQPYAKAAVYVGLFLLPGGLIGVAALRWLERRRAAPASDSRSIWRWRPQPATRVLNWEDCN